MKSKNSAAKVATILMKDTPRSRGHGGARGIFVDSPLFPSPATKNTSLYQQPGSSVIDLFPFQRLEERKKRELLLETLAQIETERNGLKLELAEHKAALLLSRRHQQESSDPRLRLLKVLRNAAYQRIVEQIQEREEIDLNSPGINLDILELLVELSNLGKLSFVEGSFKPTATGEKLFKKCIL